MVSFVDLSGLDEVGFLFLVEFFDGLVEELVVPGLGLEEFLGVALVCLVLDFLSQGFCDDVLGLFCGGFQPVQRVCGVGGGGGDVGQCFSVQGLFGEGVLCALVEDVVDVFSGVGFELDFLGVEAAVCSFLDLVFQGWCLGGDEDGADSLCP